MNVHYLELLNYLQLNRQPQALIDNSIKGFTSETRLYTDSSSNDKF